MLASPAVLCVIPTASPQHMMMAANLNGAISDAVPILPRSPPVLQTSLSDSTSSMASTATLSSVQSFRNQQQLFRQQSSMLGSRLHMRVRSCHWLICNRLPPCHAAPHRRV